MGLYQQWQQLAQQERNQEEYEAFWNAYFEKETKAYRGILSENSGTLQGTLSELAEKLELSQAETAGFLDGINTSLQAELELETLADDTKLDLKIDFEKLYYNMLNAKAPWLYGLEEWDGVLTQQARHEITKRFKTDHIYVAPKTVGRNDPCPCGSGKKYKKCCGAGK